MPCAPDRCTSMLYNRYLVKRQRNYTSTISTEKISAENLSYVNNIIVKKIRNEGGIIFCKTNTPEFGAGGNTTNKVYGTTVNPFDIKKSAAGSSGGSAAALACDMLPLANGSDYGGSLRTPSGFCGVSGFRPSPGIVPTVDSSICLTRFGVKGQRGKIFMAPFL